MARRVDIDDVFRGEDIRLAVTLSPQQDIAGKTIKFCLRREQDLSSPILAEASHVADNAAIGSFHLDLPGVSVTDRSPGEYWYDIAMVDTGSYKVFDWGMFTIKKGVRKV